MASDGGAGEAPPSAEQTEPDDGLQSLASAFIEEDPSSRFGRFDQVLGRGAFKVVYKAFDTQEGTEVAWNQVRVSELMSSKDAENKEERDRLFAEIRVLKALKHKNIMSFYDSWYDPKTYTVNFITELFTSGTLRQYRKRHKHIDEEVLKRWAWQILCGLVYLHGHNPPIIHRDLKCDNIFINGSDGVVKIGDLGLATMLRSRTAPQSVLGTPEFMAPELYEEEYDDRVDVYSFGMCLLELSTMEYPYAECKNAAQIYRKVSLGVRPAGLQKVASPELAEFINLCISPREARPRARQLLKHSFFDSIRRDKLLVSSRSDAVLAAAGAGALGDCGGSDYGGSITSGGAVSRTASSLNDLMAAVVVVSGQLSDRGERERGAALLQQHVTQQVASAGAASIAAALQGLPSASSSAGLLGGGPSGGSHPLSRTVSAEAVHSVPSGHSERAHSDSASVRSQRSNASDLALATLLEDIAEGEGEGDTTDNGEDAVAAAASGRDGGGGGAGSPGEAPGSRQASPLGSPQLAASSPAKPGSPTANPGSPTSSDGCRCDATERRFLVKGSWMDGDKRVQLRLRICEPTGVSRTVEFEFDTALDTAADVATEMEEEMELCPEDAAVIATTIRNELDRLSALPQIDADASRSLVKAAEVLVGKLEQKNSSSGFGGGSNSFRLHNRFAETPRDPAPAAAPQPLELQQLPLVPAAAAAPPTVDLEPQQPRRASPEAQQQPVQQQLQQPPQPPLAQHHLAQFQGQLGLAAGIGGIGGLRRSGGSTGSQQSLSSVSSVPHSHASAASQPLAAPAPAEHAGTGYVAAVATQVPNLSRLSPPPPPPSAPTALQQGQGQGASPRPGSPPAAAVTTGPPVDMPSPNQRVLRSNSLDAMSLLSRSASMPPGREPLASPMGGLSSGALSPSSGFLSPSTSVHENYPRLNKLFENLQDVADSQVDQRRVASPGLEAAMAAVAASPSLPPNLPPLPHPNGGRPLPPSNSGSALESSASNGGGSGTEQASSGMLRPRSEACLVMLPWLTPFGTPLCPSTSAPGASTLAAAAAAAAPAGAEGGPLSSASASSNVSPRSSAASAAADAIQRLDLQSSAPVPTLASLPPALGRPGAHALSAPPSKLPSRDTSPAREGSLSPTRGPSGGADASVALLNGKRPPIKDKEALRRQAADAMKAVEMRSLNLLEGGMGAGKLTRGVPMAAGKPMGPALAKGAMAAAAGVAGSGAPMSNGGIPTAGAPQVAPSPPPPQTQHHHQQQAQQAQQAQQQAQQQTPVQQQPPPQQQQQHQAHVIPGPPAPAIPPPQQSAATAAAAQPAPGAACAPPPPPATAT